MNDILKHKLNHLPGFSGVYLYKNKLGKIIYIGKAKNLKNRIKSYFVNEGKHKQFKTEILVRKIHDLEYIITDNELEALVLEANLIKKHKPKYNIDLKDDKSYPYIRVTKEDYPRVFVTRKIIKDGSKYLGPFSNVKAIRSLLKSLKKIFLIRNCYHNLTENTIKNKKIRLCLDYHIKICGGACHGLVKREDYLKNVDTLVSFISGRGTEFIADLKDKMLKAAENLKFEQAATYRDHLDLLNNFALKQKVENADFISRDFISLAIEDNDACCVVFKVRNGRLIARNHYLIDGVFNKKEDEILEEFIKLYYQNQLAEDNYFEDHDIPKIILLPFDIFEMETILDWLSAKKGSKVSLEVPKIGQKNKMLFLAQKNAQLLLNEHKLLQMKKDFVPRSLKSLQRDLGLKKVPILMECFDISHFSGKETVASMVCFKNAKPYKKRYRRFKVNTVEGIDDFKSMNEVVKRRYQRLVEENKEELPDLIVIDGGKGQLNAAYAILKELNLENKIEIVGLAKRLEEVFKPNQKEPEYIPRTSSALIVLKQIRDEAHRFAITYHRKLRTKNELTSILDNITGIGTKRKEKLLQKFKSVKKIAESSVEELAQVETITPKLAKTIKEYLGNYE